MVRTILHSTRELCRAITGSFTDRLENLQSTFYIVMGKTTTYRMWAITVPVADRDIDPTDQNGKQFTYNGKKWEVIVGLTEDLAGDAHRHCGIRCLDYAVSKSAARDAFAFITGLDTETLEKNYFKKVEMSWARYRNYCFKGNYTTVDAAVYMARDRAIKAGKPVHKSILERDLVEEYGLDQYNKKYKAALDTMLKVAGQVDPRGNVNEMIDVEQNAENFYKSFRIFQCQIKKCLLRNNVKTEWKESEGLFHNLSLDEKAMFIEYLALMPICLKRRFIMADKLPSLYLYGKRNTGKSSFFDGGVFLKKFPMDASGVSRFSLSTTNSGILFDDIAEDFMDKSDVSSTIKQMSLGNSTMVKTFGDTANVSGFIVVTSNFDPEFYQELPPSQRRAVDPALPVRPLEDADLQAWKENCGAWRRRFICMKFADFVDVDPVEVNWGDYNIRDRAADLLFSIGIKIKEFCPPLFHNYLAKYHDVLLRDYELSALQPMFKREEVDLSSIVLTNQPICNHGFSYQCPLKGCKEWSRPAKKVEHVSVEQPSTASASPKKRKRSPERVYVPIKRKPEICKQCMCFTDSEEHLTDCVEKRPSDEEMLEMYKDAADVKKPLFWQLRYDENRCDDHGNKDSIVGECLDCEYLNRARNRCLAHTVYNCPLCCKHPSERM